MNEELTKARNEIDLIDDGIVSLMEKRVLAVKKIAEIKKDNGKKVRDEKREKEVVLRLEQRCGADFSPYVAKLYETIFSVCRQIEEDFMEKRGAETEKEAGNDL